MGVKITDKEIIQRNLEKQPTIKIISIPQTREEGKTGECYCTICKGTFYRNRQQMTRDFNNCPICKGNEVREGINDISTTAPWMVPYFVDPDFARTHTINSGKKTKVKCPICGYIKPSETTPNRLYNQKFSCPMCSDNITFPNKMAIELLAQLPIQNWDREWRPEWSQGKIYDNYFEYNNYKYILEMDGNFHYEAWKGEGGRTLEESQNVDNLKDTLAKEHNIQMIRINCQKSEYNYIKENILNSELSNIFDLNKIDWQKIANNVNKNLVKEICEYYNQHLDKTLQEIGNVFHVSNWTVKRYLERGTECGFCKYISKKYTKQQKKKVVFKGIVEAYDQNKKLIGTYYSAKQCADELNILYPSLNFKDNKIGAILNGHGFTHRGFSFVRKVENNVG